MAPRAAPNRRATTSWRRKLPERERPLRRIDGAHGLLFERLFADRTTPGRLIHDVDGLGDAIAASLRALFSVRAPASALDKRADERTVIDYGVAALEDVRISSADERLRHAEELRRAVRAFEPRLEDVEIAIEPTEGRAGGAKVSLAGAYRLGAVTEPFHFVIEDSKKPGDAR